MLALQQIRNVVYFAWSTVSFCGSTADGDHPLDHRSRSNLRAEIFSIRPQNGPEDRDLGTVKAL